MTARRALLALAVGAVTAGATSAPVSAPGVSSSPTAQPMAVPAALTAISRFEPSGLVWVPALDRFLLVSDDTGLKDGADEGAPWLFTMDRAGRIDPKPLVVAGVDEVSDLEAIADVGDGSYYLVCSQSRSAKGKRPAKRSCLIRARLEGRQLRALGQIDLIGSLLDAAQGEGGAAWLRSLGLTVVGEAIPRRTELELDIEGATVRGGALLLGLKQPFDARSRATVWELRQVDRLFSTRRLVRSDLVRLADLPLNAEVAGRAAPAGVAELLALDDGSLLIAATSPTRGPQSGALYRLPISGEPMLVARFAGLKPEGVGLGPDRTTLYLVFDRQQLVPEWTTLALPRPAER